MTLEDQPAPAPGRVDVSADLLAELRAHGSTLSEIVVSRLGLTAAAADRMMGPLARDGLAIVLARALCDLVGVGFVEALEQRRTPLQTFNGRDALVDAAQEALDLVLYLRQARLEGRSC